MNHSNERISVLTTYKCNWNCSYCIVDTHKRNEETPINFDELEEKINSIPENSEVTLCGGEVGVLSERELNIIFSRLKEKKCTIDILTNGLFIKRHPPSKHG